MKLWTILMTSKFHTAYKKMSWINSESPHELGGGLTPLSKLNDPSLLAKSIV